MPKLIIFIYCFIQVNWYNLFVIFVFAKERCIYVWFWRQRLERTKNWKRWTEKERKKKKRNATTADAIHSWTCGYFSFTIWIIKLACIFLSWSSLVLKEKVKANSKENHIFFLFLFILWFFISMGQRKSEYTCNEKGEKNQHSTSQIQQEN